jgi:hypothetical protein
MSLSLLKKKEDKKKYIYYKWSKNGEVLEKSLKNDIVTKENINEKKIEPNKDTSGFFDYRSFSKNEEKDKNDKSIFNDRLTGREKMIQTSINPFLYNRNYLSDLKTQNEFLRPKNSSYDKI